MEETKTCTKCGRELRYREFDKRKHGKLKLQSQCKECRRNRMRERNSNEAARELKRKSMKVAYDRDPEKFREKSRKWRGKNPERQKEFSRQQHAKKCRFKMSLQTSRRAAKIGDYKPCSATVEELKVAFTGRCAVCGVSELDCSGKLCMDHDHMSAEFRGYLCRRCNTVLGLIGDDSVILDIASAYLRSHRRANK